MVLLETLWNQCDQLFITSVDWKVPAFHSITDHSVNSNWFVHVHVFVH